MHFLVSVQHKGACFTYLIKAEPDGIFIAFPQKREGLREKIFLVKPDRQWVGDADDKRLVQRIGRQIETCCPPHDKATQQPKRSNIGGQKASSDRCRPKAKPYGGAQES